MIKSQINRLRGGDVSRRSTMARIKLENNGKGVGGVKVYEVRLAEADERVRGEGGLAGATRIGMPPKAFYDL